ncbi:MAG: hypothetical protein ACTSYD_09705 [Candidatus Heimdallarchaeaceae archaeon]
MSKPKKYKGETLFNYIDPLEYEASLNVDSPFFVKLPENVRDLKLKELERELHQYWDLIHPMVREYILMLTKYVNKFGEDLEETVHLRRTLDIEIQNSAELAEENRKLKAQLSDLMIEKKGLEEKVRDLLKSRPEVSKEEVESLKLLLSSKFDVKSDDIETLLKKAVQEVRESEAIKKAKEERDKMKKELEEAKAHFEKTQQEVGETFQKKLMEYQARIEELEEELAKYKQQ